MQGKLILPTNWDPALLDRYAPMKPAYLYGALPQEKTLRTFTLLQEVDEAKAVAHIEAAREKGIGFTYVLNATCLGNEELSEDGRWQLLQRFQWLADNGVKAVVSANPFVLEIVKKEFPTLEAHVSVLAFVDDARKAKFFDDLGVDVIHLDPHVNRDLPKLESIRDAVKCRLSVLVNEGCIFSCPLRHYHSNVMSHSYQSVRQSSYIDFCYHKCSFAKQTDPAEYLRIPWIRPEDLHHFDDLGIDYFKVAGREKMGDGFASSTEALAHMAAAYHERKSENVWELLIGMQEITPVFGRADTAARAPKVFIDGAKLDGFFDYFKKGKCKLDCHRCDYCSAWAAKAVRIEGDPEPYAERLAAELESFRKGSYISGRR